MDPIERQDAIDTLNVGSELLRRVLDETNVVGTEREKYEWGLGLIESYISDMKELPSAQPEQRWIPVSKKLPDEKGEYLVTYHPCFHDRIEWECTKVGLDSFRGKSTWARKKY